MKPFEFLTAINQSKADLFFFDAAQAEKDYSPFVVNRALSYFPDTVMYANEMNRLNPPKRWQFDFLRQAVPKKKRYAAWAKKEAKSSDLDVVQQTYKYSARRAAEVLPLLSEEQLEYLRQQLDKGGSP